LAPLGEGPPDPGELFELRSDAVRVQKAVTSVLERLNARYRRAIELRFVEELPREECALALEVKIGTFDVLLLRALKEFRKEWTEVVGEKEVESDAGRRRADGGRARRSRSPRSCSRKRARPRGRAGRRAL